MMANLSATHTNRDTITDSRVIREMEAVLPLFEGDLAHLHESKEFAWTAPLDQQTRLTMKTDYANALRSALLTADWSPYEDTQYNWQATAEVLQDPELTAALLAERDPSQEVSLRRP